MKKIVFFMACLAACMTGCKPRPAVLFGEPQPAHENNQVRFKSRFDGAYLSTSDSSVLYVTSNMLIREYYFRVASSKKEIDSSGEYKIRNDSIYEKGNQEGIPVTVRHDSLFWDCLIRDTVFHISVKNILRFYKGDYFLNYKFGDNEWEVKRMRLSDKSRLTISAMDTSEMSETQKITKVNKVMRTDSTWFYYTLRPTKKELKSLIRKGGFSKREDFIKIRISKRLKE